MTKPADEPHRRRRFECYVVPEISFLCRVCRSMSMSESEAEDLAQEVLLRSYRAIDRFDGAYPRAWLYRIARNCAISRNRSRGRVVFVADPGGFGRWDATAPGLGPEAEVLELGFDALLQGALDDLRPRYRSVVDLVDIHGFSYGEAAQALGISVGTVMSRLHRGRSRIRRALSGTHLDRSGREAPGAAA